MADAVKLSRTDRDELLRIMCLLPEWRQPGQRAAFAADVFDGAQRRDDLLNRLNLDGPPRLAAVAMIEVLESFGEASPGQPAAAMLIEALLAYYIGGGDDAALLRDLLARLPSPISNPQSPAAIGAVAAGTAAAGTAAISNPQSPVSPLERVDVQISAQRAGDDEAVRQLLDAVAEQRLALAEANRWMMQLVAWAQRVEADGLPVNADTQTRLDALAQHSGNAYHYLEATLPIIPGILAYKYEVGTQHQVDLRAIWNRLTSWLFGGAKGVSLPPLRPLPLDGGADGQGLDAYRAELIRCLSQPRYRVDKSFVRLTLLVDQGRDAQGGRFVEDARKEYRDLRDALAEADDRALVVLGDPGAGKSTLLRRLQLDDAGDRLVDGGDTVSFFAPLNSYPLDAADPAAWLAQVWAEQQPGLPTFGELMRAGRLLVLLDALNEMKHRGLEHLAERIDQWRAFLGLFVERGNRAVFSCRSLDYSLPLSTGAVTVRQAVIKPMSPPQVREFVGKYLPGQAEVVWAALKDDAQQLKLFGNPYFLKLLTEQVGPDGRVPRGRAALFTGFARRALEREIARDYALLKEPGLLDARDLRQLARGEWATACQLPERGPFFPRLSGLAFAMQQAGLRDEGAQLRAPRGRALDLLDHPRAEDILAAAAELHLLDQDDRTDEVLFFHQLLQEYFAARRLAWQPDPALPAQLARSEWRADRIQPSLAEALKPLADYEPLPGAPTTGWEETVALASAMAERPGEFVGRLMEANLPLAARCAASLGETLPDGQKKALQDALIARQRDGGADLRARIAAGLALGHLGDPRFEPRHGPHGDYLLPPLVSIPGGVYGIGDDKGNYDDEKPAHRAEIKPFQIGQFAVTNAEYRRFVEAGGYEQEQWWETEAAKAWQRGEGQVEGQKQTVRDNRAWYKTLTEDNIRARVKQNRITSQQAESWLTIRNWSDEEFEAALEEALPSGEVYRLPRYWSDPDYNNPAQPVVGVCWHEARAYCAWLSAQTGRPYRLPTEVEWEAAARGLPGRFSAARAFAYGGKFDAARCNTFESHIRRTTPVGVFPGGDTSEGVADLCGNTWDWTSSAYQPYPYRFTPEREDPARTDVQYRVVRGGSWNNGQNFARAVVRDGYDPVVRYANFGFRVVVAAVPIDHL